MADKTKNQFLRGAYPLKCFLLNTASAFVIPICRSAFSHQYTWEDAWIELVIAFLYAQCIGTLFWLTLPRIWCLFKTLHTGIRFTLRLSLVSVLCVLGSMIVGLILPLLHLPIHIEFWPLFLQNVKICLMIGVTMSFLMATLTTLQSRLQQTQLQLRTQELDRERALKQATEAKLASLESRIHPHFLFNTINSVSSLIHEDPERAERLLERMAALLRFSLDSEQNGLVPLEREIKIVGDYLEIEKTRFGDRLRYSIDVSPAVMGLGIPPLSVQTLVENSVKFAVAPRRNGGQISVRALLRANQLVIEVWDDGAPFSLSAILGGHGLDNLQSRLNTLFEGRAGLEMVDQDSGKAIRMSVPGQVVMKRSA